MRVILILICFYVLPQCCSAQSGSYIHSRYTAAAYWNETLFPPAPNGRLYVYPKTDTVPSAWNALLFSVFKFSPNVYYQQCVDSIQIVNTFTADDSLNASFNQYFLANPNSALKQPDPAQYFTYQLQGITDTVYTTFTPKQGAVSGSDTEICFFIIPGSGDNQTSAILRNEGYHNLNCNVVGTLKQHGDVYVYVKPNEDFRTIRIIQRPNHKMVTDLFPTDSYLNQFLISNNRHEGINYLIQCVAAIKELKRKYKKVFLLGCSQGGYSGLYASLEAEVDGVLISSGYSVKLDDNYLQFGNMAQKFAQLPFLLVKDSIKQRISTQKTAYFFSWPPNDSPIYQAENLLKHTQIYFNQIPALSNVSYYYNYTGHAFPPCAYIDSIVQTVKVKPKAFITDTLNNCVYDTMIRKVTFIGIPPFSFSVYRNDSVMAAYTIAQYDTVIQFTQEGTYQIKQITSGNGMSGIWSDKFTYRKTPKALLQRLSAVFDCDSLHTNLSYKLKGTPPYQIDISRKDSIGNYQPFLSISTSDSIYHIPLFNGSYAIAMHDKIACEVLTDSIILAENPVQYQFISEQYDCLQHLSEFNFNTNGKPPFTLSYLKDGNLQLQTFSTTYNTWTLSNGYYTMLQLTDSNQCTYPINQFLSIEYDSLEVSHSLPIYDCNTNASAIAYSLSGNSPFLFSYNKDGISLTDTLTGDSTLYFSNCEIQEFDITDATGCIHTFTTPPYLFNQDTFRVVQFDAPVYHCDSNKTLLHIDVQGNPPYTLSYKRDFISYTYQTMQQVLDVYLDNGYYTIESITDQMGCMFDTSLSFTLSYQPLSAQQLQQQYNCDSNKLEVNYVFTGNAPWTISYFNITTGDTLSKTTNNANLSLYLDNGNYVVESVQDATCNLSLQDTISVNYPGPLTVSVLNQVYDCDSNLLRIDFNFGGSAPWMIDYIKNNPTPQYITDTTSASFHSVYLPNGLYTFQSIRDNNGCMVPLVQSANNNYSALSWIKTGQQYDCDSNKLKLDYQFTGDGPWTISYINTTSGNLYTASTSLPFFSLYLSNGSYNIQSVSDANCTQLINDTVMIDVDPLHAIITPMEINCDSAKYQTQLISNGGIPPFVYLYNFNGGLRSAYSNTDTLDLLLANGSYFFLLVTDSLGCTYQLNQLLATQYNAFKYNSYSSERICDTDISMVTFNITQYHPLWLQYEKNGILQDSIQVTNGIPLGFSKGDYRFIRLNDSLGCQDVINMSINIKNEFVKFQKNELNKDCANRSYAYHFECRGKAPWQLFYNRNNKYDSLLITDSIFTWIPQLGSYYFIELKDADQCSQLLGITDTLFPFLPETPLLHIVDNNLITLAGGTRYFWYKNNLLIDSTDTPIFPSNGDGEYYVIIQDESGCTYPSNSIQIDYPALVNIYPNPAQDIVTIYINGNYGKHWNYKLLDMLGNYVGQGSESASFLELNIQHIQRGVYTLAIWFEQDGRRFTAQLMKQ